MQEGDFLFELARAESAVAPEAAVVSRIDFGHEAAKLYGMEPESPPVSCGLSASAFSIAEQFRTRWNIAIDESVFVDDEVAPTDVTVAVRWREIHRDLSLTGVLRNEDSEARLTSIRLDSDAAQAVISGTFHGKDVVVRLPLLGDSYTMWEAMYTFIEHAERAVGTG